MRRALAGLALVLAACTGATAPSDGGTACAAVAVAGIKLPLVDSVTNLSGPFTGGWARARSGTFTDSTTTMLDDPVTGYNAFYLAWSRAGTYDVTIHMNGYKEWTRSNVVVLQQNACFVSTTSMLARLVK
jgi:hypothetical protein